LLKYYGILDPSLFQLVLGHKNIILLSEYYKKKLLKKNVSENMYESKKKSVKEKKKTGVHSIKFKFN